MEIEYRLKRNIKLHLSVCVIALCSFCLIIYKEINTLFEFRNSVDFAFFFAILFLLLCHLLIFVPCFIFLVRYKPNEQNGNRVVFLNDSVIVPTSFWTYTFTKTKEIKISYNMIKNIRFSKVPNRIKEPMVIYQINGKKIWVRFIDFQNNDFYEIQDYIKKYTEKLLTQK